MLNGLELWITRYRTGAATDVVVVVVDSGREMYGYITKEEKRVYERSRRAAVMRDARDHRLLISWLSKVQPDTLALFYAFKEGLQRRYPARKDLVRSPAFIEFMNEEGVVRIPTMTVPLTDIFRQDNRSMKPEIAAPMEIEVVDESTAALIPKPRADLAVPLNDNPFGLLDDEIDELLKGLEAIDYEEIKTLDTNPKKGVEALDMDPELSAVLNMDISDFIVQVVDVFYL